MKVLLDSCVWGGVRAELEAEGHDVAAVRDYGPDPGDEEVLNRAQSESRVLVTLDKDFGELAVVRGLPHAGIIRIVDFAAPMQGAATLNALNFYGEELASGGIVTVEPRRIRLRTTESAELPT